MHNAGRTATEDSTLSLFSQHLTSGIQQIGHFTAHLTVDVATFALRVASWSMALPKSRNTIILDEPFRYLSTDFQEKASLMLQEVSKKLGLQFIIITHEDELTAAADRVFQVRQNTKTGKSKIKV